MRGKPLKRADGGGAGGTATGEACGRQSSSNTRGQRRTLPRAVAAKPGGPRSRSARAPSIVFNFPWGSGRDLPPVPPASAASREGGSSSPPRHPAAEPRCLSGGTRGRTSKGHRRYQTPPGCARGGGAGGGVGVATTTTTSSAHPPHPLPAPPALCGTVPQRQPGKPRPSAPPVARRGAAQRGSARLGPPGLTLAIVCVRGGPCCEWRAGGRGAWPRC